MIRIGTGLPVAAAVVLLSGAPGFAIAQTARDPGVRQDAPGAGLPFSDLSAEEREYFDAGSDEFAEPETLGDGLGPRFNLDGCGGCHEHPALGGSSPPVNPQVALATAFGARNTVPSFIRANGPVREVRFKFNPNGSRDGGVHALFVVSGRVDDDGDASACNLTQPDFETQLQRNNVIFRIPTPTFGLGLIEQISDSTLVTNLSANSGVKSQFGISGRVNRTGNDGTITRFGWKAQNPSLMVFSGEAYNVEMGITNEAFLNERDEGANCQTASLPNDMTNFPGTNGAEVVGGIEKFSFFMRFLAPPTPSATLPNGAGADSISRGRALFSSVGCGLCHTPSLRTNNSTVAALRGKNVALFSDLALHNMGPRLADNVQQGLAAGDEFRTAPLWGLGQRIFFLHDGRTSDLLNAILQHSSGGNSQFGPSEANRVVSNFNSQPERNKQDILNFLRSL